MELDLEGVVVAFVETELGRLETELKSLHSRQTRLSPSDEIRLLSALKAARGNDEDVSMGHIGWADLDRTFVGKL
jgi:hypothetical protein